MNDFLNKKTLESVPMQETSRVRKTAASFTLQVWLDEN